MLEGWYGNQLGTVGAAFDYSYVPDGYMEMVPSGSRCALHQGHWPQLFACHGKRGTELGSNTNEGGDGKDIDFRSWEKLYPC